jgi:hypothetical protein
MKYYLQTRVWIRESNPEDTQMHRLGIINDGSKLIHDDLILDILQIVYMYPCTMVEENDSTYAQLRGNKDIVIAVPYKEFSKDFFKCLKDYNK